MEEDEKSIETDTKLNRPRKKKRSAIHKVESLEISGTKKVIIQGTNKEHTDTQIEASRKFFERQTDGILHIFFTNSNEEF